MVVVKLMGGLGNQLFQYAAALSLSRHHQVPLKLDVSFLDEFDGANFTKRYYELHHFNIQKDVVSAVDKSKFVKPTGALAKLLFKIRKGIYGYQHWQEQGHAFQPAFFASSSQVYLEGYFQSEQYFEQIEGLLRQQLQFKAVLDSRNEELQKAMQGGQSVAIHVRRGDYVSNAHTHAHHGVCGIDYYEQAIAYIHAQVENPVFYVFSDEPEWAEQNLPLSKAVFIQHNTGADSYKDMQLMSSCAHHIIANSSFSWWGAWLNPSPTKVVIAPQKWFASPDLDTQDLIPKKWIRL